MAEKPTAASGPNSEEKAHAEKVLSAAEGKSEKAEAKHAAPKHGSGGKSSGKKKKSAKAAETVPLSVRIKAAVTAARASFVEIVRDLASPDGPTRRMSIFFFVSLAGAIAIGVVTARHWSHQRARQRAEIAKKEGAAEHIEGFLKKEAEENRQRFSMLDLGQFTIELKPIAGDARPKGILNMAEINLVLECDTPETHTYLEENMVQARSQVTNVFLTMDRDELLTREGKRKLKKRLLERLNGWLPKGKVQNVFFSKLVVA